MLSSQHPTDGAGRRRRIYHIPTPFVQGPTRHEQRGDCLFLGRGSCPSMGQCLAAQPIRGIVAIASPCVTVEATVDIRKSNHCNAHAKQISHPPGCALQPHFAQCIRRHRGQRHVGYFLRLAQKQSRHTQNCVGGYRHHSNAWRATSVAIIKAPCSTHKIHIQDAKQPGRFLLRRRRHSGARHNMGKSAVFHRQPQPTLTAGHVTLEEDQSAFSKERSQLSADDLVPGSRLVKNNTEPVGVLGQPLHHHVTHHKSCSSCDQQARGRARGHRGLRGHSSLAAAPGMVHQDHSERR
mmetsp:Transcript_47775/g.108364  ORF Transcript_47775/g.108364 Transcript_47775/m.108364 type:complete len:294 (-) Transcript_47775:57-938(-)